MATNKTNMGVGLATGMAYRAPENTALPTSPMETLAADWELIGAVGEDGLTWALGKDDQPLKNWAKKIVRVISSDNNGSIKAPFIDTTADTLKTIFGDSNVTETAATNTHGNIVGVTIAPGVSAAPAAYLFLMKDGDDMMLVGTTSGVITTVDDITLAPNEPITWNATIESEAFTFIKDDGQTS